MAVKNVYVGKADWGYFVDLQCDSEHVGPDLNCSCKNVGIVKGKKEAMLLGKQQATELKVPMLTDWDN